MKEKRYTEEQLFWLYKDYVDELTECGTNNESVIEYRDFCKLIFVITNSDFCKSVLMED